MKWCGKIGFVFTKETEPGIYNKVIVEKKYRGIIVKQTWIEQREQPVINDSPVVTRQVRVYMNPYINENLYHIQYITYMGEKWKINNIDVIYPQVMISLGGLYTDAYEN